MDGPAHDGAWAQAMSNSRFIAIVGVIIIASIVVLAAQKMNACNQFGGKACCFSRMLAC